MNFQFSAQGVSSCAESPDRRLIWKYFSDSLVLDADVIKNYSCSIITLTILYLGAQIFTKYFDSFLYFFLHVSYPIFEFIMY